jgi:hypothetical protein
MNFLSRLWTDFWPLDRSTVGPNILASIVWALGAILVLYVVWKPLRDRVNGWVARELHKHHLLHVAPHHDAAIEHLTAIRAELAAARSDIAHLIHQATTTKENPMSILSDIEKRFSHHPSESQLVADAHDKARSILKAATAELLSVAATVGPEGREISLAVTKLEEAAFWIHAHIARNQPTVTLAPAPPVAEPPVAAPPVEPVVTPAPAPVVEAAPVPEAPVAAVPAPVAAVEAPAQPVIAPATGGVAS